LEHHAASWAEFVVVRDIRAHERETQRPRRFNESPAPLVKPAREEDAHTRHGVRVRTKPKPRVVSMLDDSQQSRGVKQKHRDALPPYKTWLGAVGMVTYAYRLPKIHYAQILTIHFGLRRPRRVCRFVPKRIDDCTVRGGNRPRHPDALQR